MEQITIFFFALASFFGIENSRIVADKTTVIVHPEINNIEVIQENLFVIIRSEDDKALALEEWNQLTNFEEKKIFRSKELLSCCPIKGFVLNAEKKTIQPHLVFNYKKEENLRAMGIWYNKEKNQFSINHIPKKNIKTKDGELIGNYWYFNADTTFSFTIEPFLQLPEDYQKLKMPFIKFLKENNENKKK